ncbi:hypothetical protein [uncultured Algibacter sp.]|uniref:DinB family protein n=1 Tax=uncultured Algibacter sp. TaxID=298659 RepID=UPI003216B34A
MNIIIESALKTLQKSQSLLDSLTNEQLCDASVRPYHSSIGSHVRHILDFYECIYSISEDNKVDLTARRRNTDVEEKCDCAKDYLKTIIDRLKDIDCDMNKKVYVIDDLGSGIIEIEYTYGALLAQANSHTIHHYAIISYIFDRLGIAVSDSSFGYNPTTPKKAS